MGGQKSNATAFQNVLMLMKRLMLSGMAEVGILKYKKSQMALTMTA
jgi:hypothetical protein